MGVNKFDSRWDTGVWMGIRDESGEAVIGTKDGVVKTRSFRRKAIISERWDKQVIVNSRLHRAVGLGFISCIMKVVHYK